MIKTLFSALLLLICSSARAGVSGSGTIIGGTDGTEIGNSSDALKVLSSQGTSPWLTSRNWTLSNGSDSIAAVESGTWVMRLQDGSGNAITSQASSGQRALDVGIDVAGTQVDPRAIRALTSSDIVTAAQGTATSLSGKWPVQVTDGTNTMPTMDTIARAGFHKITDGTNTAAVKAASTAAIATDPALAVTLSPNGNQATAANQTTLDNDLKAVQGTVAAGTAATKSNLIGGVYNTALPTLTNGQQAALQFDSSGRLITSGNVTISSTPAFSQTYDDTINAGVTVYTSYTAVAQVAVKQFYAGGTGIGRQALYRYFPATTAFQTGGDFEAAGDCGTTWVWTSGGTGSVAQSTTQANTATHSCALTFTNSSGPSAQGVKQTFGTAQDFSAWRYVTAQFFNTVSSGGAYTRTISIVLTDSAANTRTYSVSGLSTASPFNASGWIKITGEQVNPTSFTGTSFDVTQVASVNLLMTDSGNKAGTVYWDTVRFEAGLTPIAPIFHLANISFNLAIDPVYVLNAGDQIIVSQQNNDSTRKEFVALVGGVSL